MKCKNTYFDSIWKAKTLQKHNRKLLEWIWEIPSYMARLLFISNIKERSLGLQVGFLGFCYQWETADESY